MAVNYNTACKTGRMQVMADLVAGKTLGSATGTATAGSLVIQDASSVVLATITLATTAFTVSSGVATLQGTPLSDTSADATGTASKAEIRNNSGTPIITGLTVGVGGSFDVNLTSTSITATQTVTITGSPPSTITHG